MSVDNKDLIAFSESERNDFHFKLASLVGDLAEIVPIPKDVTDLVDDMSPDALNHIHKVDLAELHLQCRGVMEIIESKILIHRDTSVLLEDLISKSDHHELDFLDDSKGRGISSDV